MTESRDINGYQRTGASQMPTCHGFRVSELSHLELGFMVKGPRSRFGHRLQI